MHGHTNIKFTSAKQAKGIHSYKNTKSCKHSLVFEDGRNYHSKHVKLIGIINKPLLLHLVGCLYYSLNLFKLIITSAKNANSCDQGISEKLLANCASLSGTHTKCNFTLFRNTVIRTYRDAGNKFQ